MKIYHLTWSTIGRKTSFPEEATRRAVLQDLGRVAGAHIVLFALVDDHNHIVLRLDPSQLRYVQCAITNVLNRRSTARFLPPKVVPVETRQHTNRLVGYCLEQYEHHGLADDAAIATGSCFPDLAGARRVPGLNLRILGALPRFQLREAYAVVDIANELVPAADPVVRGLGPSRLAEAVANTFGIGPGFSGNATVVARARRVAVRLAVDVGMRASDLAEVLQVTATAAARLATRPVDPADLRAVRLRVALDLAAASRPPRPILVGEAAESRYQPMDAGEIHM